MTNQQALLSLWPYFVLSIALIIALIANARIRRRKNREIAELEKKVDRFCDLHSEENAKTMLLHEILIQTQPIYRLIHAYPSKLEAWLQTLKKPKGKKKNVKTKKANNSKAKYEIF